MAFRSCLCPSCYIDSLTHPDCYGWSTMSGMPSATPLHSAIAHNASDDVILLLIDCGSVWDLPLVYFHGVTALPIMAANGRTGLLNMIATRGLTRRDWPDHLGYRALHHAVCCSAVNSDVKSALNLFKALNRVGARLHDSRPSSQHHYAPARRLVASFRQVTYSTGATKPISSLYLASYGAWMETNWKSRSGALLDIDDEESLTGCRQLHRFRNTQSHEKTRLWPAYYDKCCYKNQYRNQPRSRKEKTR
ncbi:hypothetical protein CGRA01v4_15049 [Colletotrichum graminicola]|nr:hypothetical protein CGRA01v4_15049 [Colletotrichum graminicola]